MGISVSSVNIILFDVRPRDQNVVSRRAIWYSRIVGLRVVRMNVKACHDHFIVLAAIWQHFGRCKMALNRNVPSTNCTVGYSDSALYTHLHVRVSCALEILESTHVLRTCLAQITRWRKLPRSEEVGNICRCLPPGLWNRVDLRIGTSVWEGRTTSSLWNGVKGLGLWQIQILLV
jgi:hypothetical protein